MYKNSTTPPNNTTLWYYLGTNFRREDNSTPGVLIEEIRYIYKSIPVQLILVQSLL